MKTLLFCVVLCCMSRISQAAPSPPFEDLLQRAETVCLARIVSTDGRSVTIQCTELIRGKIDGVLTLAIDPMDGPGISLKGDVKFLLLSQGDDLRGLPRQVFGRCWDCQGHYRGWTPFLIKEIHQQSYIENIYSYADGKLDVNTGPDVAPWALTLAHIRQLVDRFPYNPKFHY